MQPECVDCGLWKVERPKRTQARLFLILLAQAANAAGAPGAGTMTVMHSRQSHFSDNLPIFGRPFYPSEVVRVQQHDARHVDSAARGGI